MNKEQLLDYLSKREDRKILEAKNESKIFEILIDSKDESKTNKTNIKNKKKPKNIEDEILEMEKEERELAAKIG